DRFKETFAALGVNANEVALKTGESNAKFYNILNGKAQPSFVTIQRLMKHYPRVNSNYLLNGKLPVLHNIGAEILGTGLIYIYLPVIVPPNAASMNNETYPVLLRENTKDNLTDCVVVRVTDSSMSPSIRPDTVLLARAVPVADWDYLNSVLVAVNYRNVLVIRRVKENDLLTKGYLTL
ncbi:helix-turn-helix domain-containing protein, partial [Fibrella forsythiae]